MKPPRHCFVAALLAMTLSDFVWAEPANLPLKAVEAFNKAAIQFNAQHYADAVPYFDQAIERAPNFAEAYYGRGMSRYHLGQMEPVLADLGRAVQLDPKHARAYAARGFIHYEKGRLQKAIEDLSATLRLDPEESQSYLGRGMAYYRLKKDAQALADFKSFLKRRPQDEAAGRLKKVVAQLEQALAPSPPLRGQTPTSGSDPFTSAGRGEGEMAARDIERFFLNPEAARLREPRRTVTGEVRPVIRSVAEQGEPLLIPKK